MSKPEWLEPTNNSSDLTTKTATKDDDNDFKFSTQINYKKFTNFFKESSKEKQKKIGECNCWVCKILDSKVTTDDKTTTPKCEDCNIVSETRDSICTPNSSSEVEKRGQIYINVVDILKQLGDQIKSLQRGQALLRRDLVKAGVLKAA